ncbi:putative tRNA-specific adenosine deaminase [Candidatus Ichthyocystis hellenicum]|uniref:tRNA-specific adenosine deaminase n=2 Tax=Burkholderiales genera incertae sedis TaxID=224471 RepID=A0A0S4M352_9BURK|nr:putative tRNA-specific adenosine deaminase [Candidatus Ichthyocystis hellenicum]
MEEALVLASEAARTGEVPVGAVVVSNNEIIGRGYNRVITNSDPTAHAEIVALRDAAVKISNYRLPGTTLYVTLEPCCMCSGAIFHARVSLVVYGTTDPKTGCAGGFMNLFSNKAINHHTKSRGGILQDACRNILLDFFSKRRQGLDTI